jgi:hypothetical protein
VRVLNSCKSNQQAPTVSKVYAVDPAELDPDVAALSNVEHVQTMAQEASVASNPPKALSTTHDFHIQGFRWSRPVARAGSNNRGLGNPMLGRPADCDFGYYDLVDQILRQMTS